MPFHPPSLLAAAAAEHLPLRPRARRRIWARVHCCYWQLKILTALNADLPGLPPQKTRGNFLKYFLSGWNWVEFCSNSLLTACVIMWWVIKEQYLRDFDINIRWGRCGVQGRGTKY